MDRIWFESCEEFTWRGLTSLLTTALHTAGESAIGFKTHHQLSKCMKSRSLPKFLVEAFACKRQLESQWKSLSSAQVFDRDSVTAAEKQFLEHSAVVDQYLKLEGF